VVTKLEHDLPIDELYRRAVPGALRGPRSRRQLETIATVRRRRRPRFNDWAGAAIVAIATLLLVSIVTLGLLYLRDPLVFDPAGRTAAGAARPPLDVPVERVVTRLPDGREVLGSFTVRLRDDAGAAELVAGAAATSAAVWDGDRPWLAPWLDTAVPRPPTVPEALIRERVSFALASLTYQQTLGDAGKERLRGAIRDSVNEALPGSPVEAVFIREYLVK
jgi:hypothetical protein